MKAFGIITIILFSIFGLFDYGSTILVLLIAIFPAKIAHNKGKDFWTWYVYASWLWIFAMIHSLVIKEKQDVSQKMSIIGGESLKKCPYCSEYIKLSATVCKFCGRDINPSKNHEEVSSEQSVVNAVIDAEKKLIYVERSEGSTEPWKCPICGNKNSVLIKTCNNCGANLASKQDYDDYMKTVNKNPDSDVKNEIDNEEMVIELSKLKDLFDKNLIDEDEYKAKKAKLLGL